MSETGVLSGQLDRFFICQKKSSNLLDFARNMIYSHKHTNEIYTKGLASI